MYDEGLAERIRQTLAASAFTEQKMFGGLCFLIGGHMACGVMGGDLLVRTGPAANQEALARPFARPMDFTGRVMKGFVIVEGAGLSETSLSGLGRSRPRLRSQSSAQGERAYGSRTKGTGVPGATSTSKALSVMETST